MMGQYDLTIKLCSLRLALESIVPEAYLLKEDSYSAWESLRVVPPSYVGLQTPLCNMFHEITMNYTPSNGP